MQDSTHSIFSSARRFLSGTLLSRITGLVRDIAMAASFGTQEAVAAFLVAFRLAHLLRRLLGEGALQTAFIPYFEKLRHDSSERACNCFKDLTVLLTFFLGLVILISLAVLQSISTWGHLSDDNQTIIHYTMLMLPSLLFICLYGLNAALLQCEKSYFIPSLAPVAFNLVWILGIFCLNKFSISTAMSWLSLFIILACAAQWLATVPLTLRILRKNSNLAPLRQNLQLRSKDLRAFIKPLTLGILGVSAAQINNALDGIFARYADLSGPAFLWYAIRLQQLPLALLGIALSGALLPPLARAFKAGDLSSYRQFLEFALRRSMSLMIPITFGIFLMGDAAVYLIYGRGGFTIDSAIGTTQCLWAYGLGLIPMTLILILSPAFYAKEDYWTPTKASLFAVFLNLALNALFVMKLNLGAPSVALATSFSAWINTGWLAWALRASLGNYLSYHFWTGIAKTFIASLIGAVSIILIDLLWEGNQAWHIVLNHQPVYLNSLLEQTVHLIVQASAFALGFLMTAYVIKSDELYLIVKS
jgi:putative peptidoglycan lipid II flippase